MAEGKFGSLDDALRSMEVIELFEQNASTYIDRMVLFMQRKYELSESLAEVARKIGMDVVNGEPPTEGDIADARSISSDISNIEKDMSRVSDQLHAKIIDILSTVISGNLPKSLPEKQISVLVESLTARRLAQQVLSQAKNTSQALRSRNNT